MAAPMRANRVDFLSDNFDPLTALYSENVQLPCPEVRPFNNLSEYENVMQSRNAAAMRARTAVGKQNKSQNLPGSTSNVMGGGSNQSYTVDPLKRTASEREMIFRKMMAKAAQLTQRPGSAGDMDDSLEHGQESILPEMMLKGKHTSRSQRNVLVRMEEYGQHEKGPLSIMYRAVKDRIRVKVWTRSAKQIRGFCKGYLVAFDRYWNMAMVDVDEIYSKPCKPRTPYPSGNLKDSGVVHEAEQATSSKNDGVDDLTRRMARLKREVEENVRNSPTKGRGLEKGDGDNPAVSDRVEASKKSLTLTSGRVADRGGGGDFNIEQITSATSENLKTDQESELLDMPKGGGEAETLIDNSGNEEPETCISPDLPDVFVDSVEMEVCCYQEEVTDTTAVEVELDQPEISAVEQPTVVVTVDSSEGILEMAADSQTKSSDVSEKSKTKKGRKGKKEKTKCAVVKNVSEETKETEMVATESKPAESKKDAGSKKIPMDPYFSSIAKPISKWRIPKLSKKVKAPEEEPKSEQATTLNKGDLNTSQAKTVNKEDLNASGNQGSAGSEKSEKASSEKSKSGSGSVSVKQGNSTQTVDCGSSKGIAQVQSSEQQKTSSNSLQGESSSSESFSEKKPLSQQKIGSVGDDLKSSKPQSASTKVADPVREKLRAADETAYGKFVFGREIVAGSGCAVYSVGAIFDNVCTYFESLDGIAYLEVRLSRSVSCGPDGFELGEVDCICF